MSVIIRLLTILSAFVTGAFLTYLIQLQLIPTKNQINKIENTTKESTETPALNTATKTLTAPSRPKPVTPAENPLQNTKEVTMLSNAKKSTNELAAEKNEVSGTNTETADDSAYELVLVKSGDSLSRLAIRHYDNRDFAYKIYEANRDVLKSPDHLVPGMQLKIPVNPENDN